MARRGHIIGDNGGRKTKLWFFDGAALIGPREYSQTKHAEVFRHGLDAILGDFAAWLKAEVPDAVVIGVAVGVAGPVRMNMSFEVSHIPEWGEIAPEALAKPLGLDAKKVHALNDVEAQAWGIVGHFAKAGTFFQLNVQRIHGTADPANADEAELVAGGSGLGHSPVSQKAPVRTEDGHATVALPERDDGFVIYCRALARRLAQDRGMTVEPRLRRESVLSGRALSWIYGYLASKGSVRPETRARIELIESDAEKAEEIGKCAHEGDPTCQEAVRTLWRYTAYIVADVAMHARSIYLCGGVLQKNRNSLDPEAFARHLRENDAPDAVTKERIDSVYVALILDEGFPAKGLAYYALRAIPDA